MASSPPLRGHHSITGKRMAEPCAGSKLPLPLTQCAHLFSGPSTCWGAALFSTEIQSLREVYIVVQAVEYALSGMASWETSVAKQCLLCICRSSLTCRYDDLVIYASCTPQDDLLEVSLWRDNFLVNVFSFRTDLLRISDLVLLCFHAMAFT